MNSPSSVNEIISANNIFFKIISIRWVSLNQSNSQERFTQMQWDLAANCMPSCSCLFTHVVILDSTLFPMSPLSLYFPHMLLWIFIYTTVLPTYSNICSSICTAIQLCISPLRSLDVVLIKVFVNKRVICNYSSIVSLKTKRWISGHQEVRALYYIALLAQESLVEVNNFRENFHFASARIAVMLPTIWHLCLLSSFYILPLSCSFCSLLTGFHIWLVFVHCFSITFFSLPSCLFFCPLLLYIPPFCYVSS